MSCPGNSNPRLIIAGTHSGVGKTTITLGIILALKEQGLKVQSFKAGPDYIDPGFHTRATGRSCRNLDSMLLSRDKLLELFERNSKASDISIIEGVMGFFDGAGPNDQRGSTSHLAKILKAPVILVIDAKAAARSAAAVALGFVRFERNLCPAGFILNNIGSENHYKTVKQAIENRTHIPVLGYLPRNENLKLPERHLGLVPAWEKQSFSDFEQQILKTIKQYVDIDSILKIAENSKPLPPFKLSIFNTGRSTASTRIALALDHAFHFYYEDNLDILKNYGAEIIPFSPLKDKKLPPDTAGIYLGGGFPELFARELSDNLFMKKEILEKASRGMPVFAECGGLMYLVKRLVTSNGEKIEMAGVFPGEIRMGSKLKALGYCNVTLLENTILGRMGTTIKGHVFHWSYYTGTIDTHKPEGFSYGFQLEKSGSLSYDGLMINNVLASYVHIHFGSKVSSAKNFINSTLRYLNE